MTNEQSVQAGLVSAFPWLDGCVRVTRERRIFVEAPLDRVYEVFEYLTESMDFTILCTITGLDLGSSLGVLYHLAQECGLVLTLSASVPRDHPVIRSVTGRFPAADAYERELVDMLGFQVQGLAPGHRYPLPDGWHEGEYPLRKDWKGGEEGAGCSDREGSEES